ncbi:MAG: glycerol kinase GlpK [Hyphomonadaceae bacterium]|nr:glycerol kinase GlpK [Hyphomonadaceae bacterium]
MSEYILVIDEGTSSTRAIAFDREFQQCALAQSELGLAYPEDGWVEQDGEEIWQASLSVLREVVDQLGGAAKVAAIGIANQRETSLIWERQTGRPVGPAIVWQDRRTHAACDVLKAEGREGEIQAVTGLLADPYFSATKIAWMKAAHGLAPADLAAGRYAFGTVDSWLVWKLTGGGVHATDITNASRTLLMDLETGNWSPAMLDLFGVERGLLPEIRSSGGAFGRLGDDILGAPVPILSAIGDQQAALVGQGCLKTGQGKITLGTGAFLVANTGSVRSHSEHALLATSGYDTGTGASAFALEGAIFNAGTVVKWLRDELGLIDAAADSEALARSVESTGGVCFMPAFTGLGAPHWKAGARGEITGITRATRAAHIVRAGLEATAYQTRDLLTAFAGDGARVDVLRVDGGMAANDWLMQFMADICALPVERPDYMEMTALGAAALAGMHLGWTSAEDWSARRAGTATRFAPAMSEVTRQQHLANWQRAVSKAVG